MHLQLVKCREQTDEGSDTVNVKLQTAQSSTQHAAAAAAAVEQADESPAALTAPPPHGRFAICSGFVNTRQISTAIKANDKHEKLWVFVSFYSWLSGSALP